MNRKGTGKSEIAEVLEVVNFLKDRVMTREETQEQFSKVNNRLTSIEGRLTSVEDRLTSIEREIRDINHRLDRLEERFGNIKGVTKEIDELRSRIKVIERHLKVKV